MYAFVLTIPLYLIYIYNQILLKHDSTHLLLVTIMMLVLLGCEQLLLYYRGQILALVSRSR